MNRIILIETSTSLCSTALVEDGKVVCERLSSEPRAHASMTAPYVNEMLKERGLGVKDCSAVAVSKGPGSYTGLRVGVSTAKGLCFGAGIPLISVGTLDTLVWQAMDGGLVPEGCRYIIPMVDARRMEVYTAVFTTDGKQVTPTEAMVVGEESFKDQLSEGPVLFIGDGAGKCQEVIGTHNAFFVQCCPKASGMTKPAVAAFNEGRFEDVAYFEPYYLKEFMTTTSKKKLF
ncbi:MAG: tRNA (adenosine(37)-N6)-threonylcarbamoyltransferase complex dimerization subunit type 1 TsaB [Bacteroidales bacterium]|nr:tRNA (adenosine(37)-N6)-threonylcarbamoyltransferase complex dimerization subunit type 1 TsaB [Bacteroidales bacterium]